LKHIAEHVVSDPRVKQESLEFLLSIVQEENFSAKMLDLLLSGLRS
jgi:hypothetical protein